MVSKTSFAKRDETEGQTEVDFVSNMLKKDKHANYRSFCL